MEDSNAGMLLEGHLRSMIIGNAALDSGTANSNSQTQQAHNRGRGRGRGSTTRGNQQNRAGQNSGRGHNSSSNTGLLRGGGGRAHPPGNYPSRDLSNFVSIPIGPIRIPQDDPQQPYHQQNQPSNHPDTNSTMRGNAPRVFQQRRNGKSVDREVHHSASAVRPQDFYRPQAYNNYTQKGLLAQNAYLDNLATYEIPKAEMSVLELKEKEAFRTRLEGIIQKAFKNSKTGEFASISLVGFGSLASGFAMPGSDMDLAVVTECKCLVGSNQGDNIPRLLERAVLDAKMGGRLLTRTRVPILKVCELPTQELYSALYEERQKWDRLSEEEKYPSNLPIETSSLPKALSGVLKVGSDERGHHVSSPSLGDQFPAISNANTTRAEMKAHTQNEKTKLNPLRAKDKADEPSKLDSNAQKNKEYRPRVEKPWMREKVQGPLDFPKTGCGIQCDINFENPLGIHNSQMLRCYSLTDPRVRPIVLFVKSWAKQRKVNSAYSGTLSSYGWVLMVLHYLVNVTKPPVCPNLQQSVRQPTDVASLEKYFKETTINGYHVRFWRNEQEILQAAQAGRLTSNKQSIGSLLRGFFQYYASMTPASAQFYWTNEVLSLRMPGGLQTKQSKGWVSATTKITAEKKVTNRYLFAIEDPFETDHNVARTVTHRGIVAIRDEFRRSWRILKAVGQDQEPEGGFFDEVVEKNVSPPPAPLAKHDADVGKTGT